MHTFIVTFDDNCDFIWNCADATIAMERACSYWQKNPAEILVVKVLN